MTQSINVSVENDNARNIAMLVQIASQYKSKISISQDDKTVNAKSIMGMMTLGLVPGQTLGVSIEGEDEADAMESIRAYLQNSK